MRVAIINDNVVNEIKDISEEAYITLAAVNQSVIDISDILPQPQVGWKLEGSKLVSNGNDIWLITKLAARQRFTLSEISAFTTAAKTNVLFEVIKDNLTVATFVDLKRPDTIQFVGALYQAGIITLDRMQAILSTPPSPLEAYKGQ